MENEKYFTPDISDIRVGYECEMSSDGFEFFKTIIDITDISDLTEWYKCGYLNFDDLSEVIRVPYLSKEQIIAEGWKISTTDIVHHLYGKCTEFMKDVYILNFFEDVMTVRIWCPIQYTSYYGPCKDINTFRYLNKLLNI